MPDEFNGIVELPVVVEDTIVDVSVDDGGGGSVRTGVGAKVLAMVADGVTLTLALVLSDVGGIVDVEETPEGAVLAAVETVDPDIVAPLVVLFVELVIAVAEVMGEVVEATVADVVVDSVVCVVVVGGGGT